MVEIVTSDDLFNNPQLFISGNNVHAKQHSKSIDKILGYEIGKIEQSLLKKYQAYFKVTDEKNKKQHYQGSQTWIGIHPQTLQTPYEEILKALIFLNKINVKRVIDIGAAYGRVGLITKCVLPEVSFIGYEILKKRVDEGNRIFKKHLLENCELVETNVLESSFSFPEAEVFFIYDFSEPEHIEYIIKKLIQETNDSSFYLVCRGYAVEDLLMKKFKSYWSARGYLKAGLLKIYKFN
jgi:16S rRNA G527 N7-methylase RsmG